MQPRQRLLDEVAFGQRESRVGLLLLTQRRRIAQGLRRRAKAFQSRGSARPLRTVGHDRHQLLRGRVLVTRELLGVLRTQQVGAPGRAEQQRPPVNTPTGPASPLQDVGRVIEGKPRRG